MTATRSLLIDRKQLAVDSHRSARSGEWLAEPGFGIYVHVPFCLHRCHYCDFNTYEGLDALFEPYVDALVKDIERFEGAVAPVTSVFLGGGTPTLLDTSQLARVLGAVRRRTSVELDAEVTIEVNPETVDEAKFTALLEAGFNRFSIGVQSLLPHVLKGLGRTHSAQRALEAMTAARGAGAKDVNVDLIYGSPWERDEDWSYSLNGVIDAGPDHVSAYALTLEEGTPLHTLVATDRVPDVDPDLQARRHELASELLARAGYERYEVSNWCRPARASRHNVLYWSAGDYLGFGAGAHAHNCGRRSWSVKLPRDYIAAVEVRRSAEAGREWLSPEERATEALMLGLRLTSGIDTGAFDERFGESCLAERAGLLRGLSARGLMENQDGWLRVAESATMVANDIICRLL